ncbi:GDP-mannose-dependent alpha-(1-6)-phosphatidylinositol monomannoside mannosyltransferase [Paenibacillus konkukensis]|uniref:GDP-mannose-dependent alpha-(1-6)-phosphatidylinositol monomannoside mannosyltransferase n=1 Tax=Paenibacillus konkukensis TaxID=2020716 RepID=A0ABY4RQ78_9BACL|nr:glycosyltransferase [Paenibacillus konkukensis]UQZ84338.1 GDP-mannose-dependent alpha-(1-6)-phosphatidylinositol monomannoside mannosyltransferase [Paenibacillus konkukensis]
MRILFLSAGNSVHTVRWVNALSERGHEVHLIYNNDHVPLSDKVNDQVIQHKLKRKGVLAYYLNARELSQLCKNIRPEIINVHYASGYGTLARVANLNPIILSVWGSDVYDFPYESKIKMSVLRKNIRHAHIIASTSYSMAKQVERLMDAKINVTITPFGVDTNIFKPMKRIKENFTFGVVKTLLPKYGISYIIKGFKILLNRIQDEKLPYSPILEIYGKGSMEKELKHLCDDLMISDKVFFRGYIPNKEIHLAINKMDVFCLGSVNDSESFGVAAVEAMACEVPVIATDVSGFKEVVVDGETGFLIPRKDEKIIAEKMYELMIDDNLRRTFGGNGRKRVLSLYDWKSNVDLMEELYKRHCKSSISLV